MSIHMDSFQNILSTANLDFIKPAKRKLQVVSLKGKIVEYLL